MPNSKDAAKREGGMGGAADPCRACASGTSRARKRRVSYEVSTPRRRCRGSGERRLLALASLAAPNPPLAIFSDPNSSIPRPNSVEQNHFQGREAPMRVHGEARVGNPL